MAYRCEMHDDNTPHFWHENYRGYHEHDSMDFLTIIEQVFDFTPIEQSLFKSLLCNYHEYKKSHVTKNCIKLLQNRMQDTTIRDAKMIIYKCLYYNFRIDLSRISRSLFEKSKKFDICKKFYAVEKLYIKKVKKDVYELIKNNDVSNLIVQFSFPIFFKGFGINDVILVIKNDFKIEKRKKIDL